MSGGTGVRFWPMSRESKPKQFLDILHTGQTLIQTTYNRYSKVIDKKNIRFVLSSYHVDLLKEQIQEISDEQIIVEPDRRNTAPAIAYASAKIFKKDPDAILVFAPADHLIDDEDAFAETLNQAIDYVKQHDVLMTLGIKPTRPDTGFGYIQFIPQKGQKICKVKTFTEKPALELARTFIRSGDFLWNAGIFVWKAKTIIDAFKQHEPDIYNAFLKDLSWYYTEKEPKQIEKIYSSIKKISVDYAIMEKANNVYTIISEFPWNDLGTWASLHEKRPKDENNNSIIGKNVMTYDTQDCLIQMPNNKKLVVIEGLKNFIVVENDDMLLILNKDHEQSLRNIVQDILIEKGSEYI
jgi:mannose-1-phosphate guanylyltransferase